VSKSDSPGGGCRGTGHEVQRTSATPFAYRIVRFESCSYVG
jgi:hypothetical protein